MTNQRSEKVPPLATEDDMMNHEDPASSGPRKETPSEPYLRLQPFMSSLRELRTPHLWRDIVCEVFLTFLLLFFVMGMGFNFHTPEKPTTPLVLAGLGTGVYVFALIEGFGHIQLAAMNPAAAIFFTLTGKMSVIKGFLCITAECLGSILGTALVYSCAPSSARVNFKPLALHPNMNVLQGVVIEWVITGSLIFILAGALDERNRKVYMPGLPVGMAVGAGILMAGNFTGGALNPVITFGPAVVTGVWENQWVYWVGPLLGGLSGTLMYHGFTYDKGVFRKAQDKNVVAKYKEGVNNNQNDAATPLRRPSNTDPPVVDHSRC